MTRSIACVTFLWMTTACSRHSAPAAIDPGLAACVPPGATAIAGVRLEAVRATPAFIQLMRRLPATPLLDQATEVLVTWSGTELLMVSRGRFPKTPAGATLLAPTIAAIGSSAAVELAARQLQQRQSGAPELVADAEPVARDWPVWAVISGNNTLPLSGNGANLNRLLHSTHYVSLGLRPSTGWDVSARGVCRSVAETRQLESTVRALITLAQAGSAKSPELSKLLSGVTLTQQEESVLVTMSVSTDNLNALLQSEFDGPARP